MKLFVILAIFSSILLIQAQQTYTVQQGDTLGSIAQQFYQDENQWQKIYSANQQTIGPNPNVLTVGMTLTIPDVSESPSGGSQPPSGDSTTGGNADTTLYSGAGEATFYYDINGGGTCGPVNGISSYPETQGYAMCEGTNPAPKKLAEYNTNDIVAMPNGILRDNLSTYCGKKVIVSVNGREFTELNLVIWDGCEACNGNNGLDFSSTVFGQLFGPERCAEGRIAGELSWRIVDEQVIAFNHAAGGGSA